MAGGRGGRRGEGAPRTAEGSAAPGTAAPRRLCRPPPGARGSARLRGVSRGLRRAAWRGVGCPRGVLRGGGCGMPRGAWGAPGLRSVEGRGGCPAVRGVRWGCLG